jgi:hypothetical protein
MTVEQSTPGSYFMAVGWNTGYFGIQELNAATNKVVIFSVWDPSKGDNANAVPAEQRVEVLHSDPGVRIKRFGGEGTGGQAMWNYNWRIGETNRFCLRATVQGDKTAYAACFFVPEEKRWRHLATFRTTTKGSPLKGYYSFVEDFRRDTKSVNEVRRALGQAGHGRLGCAAAGALHGVWRELGGEGKHQRRTFGPRILSRHRWRHHDDHETAGADCCSAGRRKSARSSDGIIRKA